MTKNQLLLFILMVNLSLQTQAQVATIYTLPIFEVNQSDTVIVGLRVGESDSDMQSLANRKMGVYLNNPFQHEKQISQAQFKFEKIGRKIDSIRMEIFPAKLDSFPDSTAIFDTTIEVSKEKNYWLKVNIPNIPYPSNGVVIAYTLMAKNGAVLDGRQTGSIATKTFSEPHRIGFDYWQGTWRRYPFDAWRNDPTTGYLVRAWDMRVPLISLTLVNSKE